MKQQTTLVKALTFFLTLTFAAAYTQLDATAYTSIADKPARQQIPDQYVLNKGGERYTIFYPQIMPHGQAANPVTKADAQQKTWMLDLLESECQNFAWNRPGVDSIGKPHPAGLKGKWCKKKKGQPDRSTIRIDSGNTSASSWRAMEYQMGERGTYAKVVFDTDAQKFDGDANGQKVLQAYFEEGMQLSARDGQMYRVKVEKGNAGSASSGINYHDQQKAAEAANQAAAKAALQQQAAADAAAAALMLQQHELAQAAALQNARQSAAAQNAILQVTLGGQAAAVGSPSSSSASSPRSDASDLSVDSTVSTNSSISGIAMRDDGSLVNATLGKVVPRSMQGTVKAVEACHGVEWALIRFRNNAGQEGLVYVPASQFCHLERDIEMA